MGLSDGSTWKARSGSNRGESKGAQTVLDMRGSNPLSRSKRFTLGKSNNYKYIVKMRDLIKELENLYSWSQFYQERKQRKKVQTTQIQIKNKKQELNEFKMVQKAKRGGKK